MINIMPKKQPRSATKDSVAFIRMEKKLRDELKEEAIAEGRDLSSYIRHMLATDPRRQKLKK